PRAGSCHRPLHRAERRRSVLLPGSYFEGAGQGSRSLHVPLQGGLEPGVESAVLLRAGGDCGRARRLSGGAPFQQALYRRQRIQHPATAQETAAEYLNDGLWQDGIDVLLQMRAAAPKASAIQPMVNYYLGEFAAKLGQAEKASEYRRLAMAMPPDYVFPFQNEAIDVLRQAIAANP